MPDMSTPARAQRIASARPTTGRQRPFSRWLLAAGLLCGAGTGTAQAIELRIPAHPGADAACTRIWKRLGTLIPDFSVRVTVDHATAARRDLMLRDGSLDADCGTIPAPQETGLRYSARAVYSVRIVLVARRDDPVEVRDVSELRRLSVAAPLLLNRGSQFRGTIEKLGITAIDDQGAHTEQNIQKLLAGHGRLFVFQQPSLDGKLREFGLQGRVRVLSWSPGTVGYHLAYSAHLSAATIDRIEAGLAQLARNGELGTSP